VVFIKLAAAAVMVSLIPAAAIAQANDSLTHGSVQLNVKVGETTQTEILEAFGSPNITSIDGSGQEVWVFERHSTVSTSSSQGSYGTLGLVGASKSKKKSEVSTRQTTLIIKFDEKKIVSDEKSCRSIFCFDFGYFYTCT
jgi:outer membrane protein assembly factor BamE (lipoprotein component of BamABCDE complex)